MLQHKSELHLRSLPSALQWMDRPILCTSSPADGHLDGCHSLAVVNKVAVNIRVHSFVWTYVFHPPEDVQGVELLGHVASLYLTCGETASLFPWQPHRLRSASTGRGPSSHALTALIVHLSRPGPPGGVKWDLAVVWVCFPLMTNGVAHLPRVYWPLVCLLCRNVYSSPLPIS